MQSPQLVTKPSYSFIRNSAKRAFFEDKPPTPKIKEKVKNSKRRGVIKKLKRVKFGIFQKLYRARIFGQIKKISKSKKTQLRATTTPTCPPPKQDLFQKIQFKRQRLTKNQKITKSDAIYNMGDDSPRSMNNNYQGSENDPIWESEFSERNNFYRNSVEAILQPCNRTDKMRNDVLTVDQIAILEMLMKRNIGLVPIPYRKPTTYPTKRNLKEETTLLLTGDVDCEQDGCSAGDARNFEDKSKC